MNRILRWAMKLPKLQWLLEEIFIRSSWVIFIIFICLMVYERNLSQYRSDLAELQLRVSKLTTEITTAEVLNNKLKLQIRNHDNPTWVTLVLIEELGLVPEGHQKVLFK